MMAQALALEELSEIEDSLQILMVATKEDYLLNSDFKREECLRLQALIDRIREILDSEE